MTNRQTPPGRMSKLNIVVLKPFGPHHCARCFGSLKAEKTQSRGASNSRTPMIERGSRSMSMLSTAAIFSVLGRFCLQRFQVVVEPIEAGIEKTAVGIEPRVDVLQRPRLDPARPPLRSAGTRDQASALQHFEMLGDRREAHGERL